MTLRLLAVHAHPDDESSKGAATYAYYRDRGAEVTVVSCTGGERGDVQNPALEPLAMAMAERDMTGLRRIEMEGARAAMGIGHRWLGFFDSGLPEGDEVVREDSFSRIPLEISGPPLVRIIRELRPQVVVTYDENGGYPHPDHIRAHEITVWALAAAADPGYRPDLGPAWEISKLYYDRIFNAERLVAVYDALLEQQPDSPLVADLAGIREWMGDRGTATTHVPAGDFFEVRDVALRSHASQVPPDSSFFYWPNDLQREVWPTEDFELVRSSVPTTQPETDLFAGITDEEPE